MTAFAALRFRAVPALIISRSKASTESFKQPLPASRLGERELRTGAHRTDVVVVLGVCWEREDRHINPYGQFALDLARPSFLEAA